MKKNTDNQRGKVYDKYGVEASSLSDLDGCATTELTGLIPSLPESEAEIQSYEDILPFSPECFIQKQSREAPKQ